MYKVERRYKRYRVDGLDIHAKTVFATEVEILDISLSGACIKSVEKLNVGRDYLIWFEHEGIFLALKCLVKWQNTDGSQKATHGESIPVYTAGIEFQESLVDKMSQLKDYISRLKLSEEHKFAIDKGLRKVRFKLDSGSKAHLNYEETYPVKKVSLGGMLVETGHAFAIDKSLPMELFLPGNNHPMRFQVRVASSINTPDKICIDTGFEFLDLTKNDRTRLSKFIESL